MGDKATPASLMAAFGIKNYKSNPKPWDFDQQMKLANKYGPTEAVEIEEWQRGPSCDDYACVIPFGVTVGNDDIPVSLSVGLHHGLITEIDVSFNEIHWDEIRSILNKKYGENWKVERDQYFLISDYETKKSNTVERVTITLQTDGKNKNTDDSCNIWATNYDEILQHHDPLGTYHSVFVIKLVSRNF